MIRILMEFWWLILALTIFGVWWGFWGRKMQKDVASRVWFWVVVGSLATVIITLLSLGIFQHGNPSGHYTPAIVKDGKIVPGHVDSE